MLAVLEIPQYGFQILRPLTAELKTFRKEELLAYPFLDFPQPVIHLYKPSDLLLYQRTATTILYPVSRDSLFNDALNTPGRIVLRKLGMILFNCILSAYINLRIAEYTESFYPRFMAVLNCSKLTSFNTTRF